MRFLTPIIILLNCTLLYGQSVGEIVLNEERSFAQMAKDSGTKIAFLNYLSPKSIVFSEGKALNGINHWESLDFNGRLDWDPSFIEISDSKDLAYTVGTFQFYLEKNQEKPTQAGVFSSIWQKQDDGKWKVSLDIGSTNLNEQYSTLNLEPSKSPLIIEPSGNQFAKIDTNGLRVAIFYADFMLSNNLKRISPKISSYSKRSQIFSKSDEKYNYKPLASDVAASADLAYVYGTVTDSKSRGNYLRIWKKESRKSWKVVLEIVNI